MRDLILAIASEVFLFSPEEAERIILRVKGGVNPKTLERNLESLAREKVLLALEPGESTLQTLAFIQGPDFRGEPKVEVKSALLEEGLARRGYEEVHWERVVERLLEEIEALARELEEDIKLLYEPPRKLEMRYFDLSLEYHQHYSHFLRLNFSDVLGRQLELGEWEGFSERLAGIREMLDKLEY
ncbi:hypothetical protein [Candidatus Pyrohabitans sp.]